MIDGQSAGTGRPAEIAMLAGLGGASADTDWQPKYPNNVKRDLLRRYVGDVALRPVTVRLPCIYLDAMRERRVDYLDHPIVPPHMLLAALQEAFPTQLQSLLDLARSSWAQLKRLARQAGHTMRPRSRRGWERVRVWVGM
jgi:hypothetical protein